MLDSVKKLYDKNTLEDKKFRNRNFASYLKFKDINF